MKEVGSPRQMREDNTKIVLNKYLNVHWIYMDQDRVQMEEGSL
jgi:hypothetical protein